MPKTPEHRSWITTQEIAAECQVTIATIVGWIMRGIRVNGKRVQLKAQRMGTRFRLQRKDVDDFLRIVNAIPVVKD